MVIVEGPDGAGKSTLVKQLQDLFPELKTGERGTDNRDLLWTVTRSDTYNALRLALTPEEPPRIWDRLYWSEFVYYPFTSRECQFTIQDQMLIPSVIAGIAAPVIWCLPPKDLVLENEAKAHQMEGVSDNISDIYDAYVRMGRNLDDPRLNALFWYDYSGETPGYNFAQIAETVARFIQERPA